MQVEGGTDGDQRPDAGGPPTPGRDARAPEVRPRERPDEPGDDSIDAPAEGTLGERQQQGGTGRQDS